MKTIVETIVAALRFGTVILALFIMMIVIGIAALTNIKIKEIPLSGWLTRSLVIFVNLVLNVKIHVEDKELFQNHHGFIFPNHTTFIDILVAFEITPVRFLAMAAVDKMPFIGSIARSIGCVFVNRKNKESRTAARDALIDAPKFPPMILYPEGYIQPPPTEISPLRYGAFEIAQDTDYSCLPCVLIYDKLDLVFWTEKNTFLVAWNFCKHMTRINVKVCPLPIVSPKPGDDIEKLAKETRQAMMDVLTHEHKLLGNIPS
ncbi:MAG: 1-acyl-sn-glycerol-3-phosphate acyltransferase [Chloroflexota bacterium]